MPTVKNVALDPLELPTGALLLVGKTANLSDEQLRLPTIAALLTEGKLTNVDEAPALAPPSPPETPAEPSTPPDPPKAAPATPKAPRRRSTPRKAKEQK